MMPHANEVSQMANSDTLMCEKIAKYVSNDFWPGEPFKDDLVYPFVKLLIQLLVWAWHHSQLKCA